MVHATPPRDHANNILSLLPPDAGPPVTACRVTPWSLSRRGKLVLHDVGRPDYLQHKRSVTGCSLATAWGLNAALWCFAGLAAVAFVTCILLAPETKGQGLEPITGGDTPTEPVMTPAGVVG